MKLKQIVIRYRRGNRGKDYGVVTRDPMDVYAKCVEAGMDQEEATLFYNWSKHARFGGKFTLPYSSSYSAECRDPMRDPVPDPETMKPKRRRGKGTAHVG